MALFPSCALPTSNDIVALQYDFLCRTNDIVTLQYHFFCCTNDIVALQYNFLPKKTTLQCCNMIFSSISKTLQHYNSRDKSLPPWIFCKGEYLPAKLSKLSGALLNNYSKTYASAVT